MTTLREAAQQALEALLTYEQYIQPLTNVFGGPRVPEEGSASAKVDAAITALRSALAEPVQEPVAWMHTNAVGHVYFRKKPQDRVFNPQPLYTAPPRCPNCASLEAQNTELDRKLADLEQTSLELCETCGWRTLIPGEGCLNCARSKQAEQEPVTWRWGYRSVTTGEMDWRGYVEIPAHPNLRSPAIIMEPLYTAPPQRKPLPANEIVTMYDESPRGDSDMIAFARAIERAHGIGEKE